MSIISYAQNFEDVMLWRALGHVKDGFYIDIGAQDPLIDSVSLAFHEHGWRGIHVEPTPHYAELLRQQRPGDTVIQAAVGKGPAKLRFFEIPDTGISTADPAIAQQHRERGFDVHEITVPCIALSAIFKTCAESEIHWLKIDVEGFEKQVLSSWGKSAARPWIVVVESTLPLTQIETHESWEAILIGYGYTPVYFDGLNRYYISDAHPELKNAFLAPPNVFDGFALNGTASATFHHLIDARYKGKISEILAQKEQQKQSATEEIESLTLSLVSLDKVHAEQTSQTRQELESLLRTQAQREQEFAAQLLTIQQQAAQEKAEQARGYSEQERALQRQHAQREQILTQQLQVGQQELRRLEQERARREREHAEQTGWVRQELETLLRTQVHREQEVAVQLQAIQQQANQDQAELVRNHSEQERALQSQHTEREQTIAQQLQAGQQEIRRMEQERVLREEEHAKQTNQIRQELETHQRSQIQREQELAAQLLDIQRQAAQEMAEQSRNHSEQERVLHRQLNEQLRVEREASRELQEMLNTLQRELVTMRNDLYWQFTAPLRAVAGWFRLLPTYSAIEQRGVASTPYSVTDMATSSTQKVISTLDDGKQQHSIGASSSSSTVAPDTRPISNFMKGISMFSTSQANSQGWISPVKTLDELLAYHDQAFIQCAYRTLLGREPDIEGANYYLRRLRSGVSKIQILAQLCLSKEAAGLKAEVIGLDDAISAYRLGRLPLVGWLYRLLNGLEGSQFTHHKLRIVENQIYVLGEQSKERFSRIESTLSAINGLIVRQSQLSNAVGGVAPNSPSVKSMVLTEIQESFIGFHRSIPHEKDIYGLLKHAIAMNRNKGKV